MKKTKKKSHCRKQTLHDHVISSQKRMSNSIKRGLQSGRLNDERDSTLMESNDTVHNELNKLISVVEKAETDEEFNEAIEEFQNEHMFPSVVWTVYKDILSSCSTSNYNKASRDLASKLINMIPWEKYQLVETVRMDEQVRFDTMVDKIRDTNTTNLIFPMVISNRQAMNNYVDTHNDPSAEFKDNYIDSIDGLIICIYDEMTDPRQINCSRCFYIVNRVKSDLGDGVHIEKMYYNPITENAEPICTLVYSSAKSYIFKIGYTAPFEGDDGTRGVFSNITDDVYDVYDACGNVYAPTFIVDSDGNDADKSTVSYILHVYNKFAKRFNQIKKIKKSQDDRSTERNTYVERTSANGHLNIVKLDSVITEYQNSIRDDYEYQGGTHRSPVEHLRRGHYRHYKNGKTVFVQSTIVNKGNGITVYKND